jgi:xanthine dehydrogenase accessory factor
MMIFGGSRMKELYSLIKERLSRDESLVIVTLTETSGSTPREAGAMMLVGNDETKAGAAKRLWGSIGGGISEHLAIEEAGQLLEKGKNGEKPADFFKSYTLRPDEAADLGARCGGEITVSFRFIAAGDTELLEELEKEANSLASEALVYVFGGGHIAQELVPLLGRLDFRSVVFDDREEFSRPELFPSAGKTILGDFLNIEKSVTLTEKDFAVIITRGHEWDLDAWAFALRSPALYIGVIGSRTKHEFVKTQLRERGFMEEAYNAPRVHAPIGLDIGSNTPAEIAVSIAGELILTRSRSQSGSAKGRKKH